MVRELRKMCVVAMLAGSIPLGAAVADAVSFNVSVPTESGGEAAGDARESERGAWTDTVAEVEEVPGPTPTSAPDPLAKVAGKDVSSDFVAKHFSLLFGAVVLNQFKIDSTMEAPKTFTLENGNTEAKAFLEGGFRYRWAWLDRDSAVDRAVRSSDSAIMDARKNVNDATRRVKAAELALKAAEDLAAGEAKAKAQAKAPKGNEEPPDPESIKPRKATTKSATPKPETPKTPDAIDAATAQLAAAKKVQIEGRNELEDAVEVYLRGQPRDESEFFSLRTKVNDRKVFALVPDDWTARLGYVFDSSTSANDVVAVVGATDLYGEFGFGWNIVYWGFAPDSVLDAPIRGSINLELDGTIFTDANINDAHGRGIFGLAFVFGVPIRSEEPTIERIVAGQTSSSQSVVELLVRAGAVVAEVPAFENKETNTLKQEHGNPKYVQDWGFGMDFELNVPIAEKLGYIVARGQMNADFDPNPWFIQLGYTIPLGTLAAGITGGNGG